MASKHPRSPALHAAAEAAGAQGAFFEFVDSLYADRGHVDDPHLWERARALGLDLERFERDRRSAAVAARVRRDFESGDPRRRRRHPGGVRCLYPYWQLENESSESKWPPTGRPEVDN